MFWLGFVCKHQVCGQPTLTPDAMSQIEHEDKDGAKDKSHDEREENVITNDKSNHVASK